MKGKYGMASIPGIAKKTRICHLAKTEVERKGSLLKKKKNIMEKTNRKCLWSLPTREPAGRSCKLADAGSKPTNKGGLHGRKHELIFGTPCQRTL